MNIDDLFEEKGTKAQAGYQPDPKNGQKCINCTMWRDPNKCSAVAGSINPNGWCKWYAGGAYGKRGKKIDEIRMTSGIPQDIDFTKDSQNSSYLKTFEKTPYTVGGFPVYYRFASQEHTFHIMDESSEGLKILADMTLSPYDNGYYESTVRFSKELRGRGFASQLYALAITKYKIKIISDNQQTPGSKKLWHELVTGHPSIFTYIVDEYEETIRPATAENFDEAYLGDDEYIRLLASPSRIRTSLGEDGRIVRGVNTTVDVGPNEISKQSKKFGNKVNKDGFPPTLNSNGIVEERYTLREWAAIQGGHSLEDAPTKKLFDWLNTNKDNLDEV
jgi:hypothetical protein